MALDATMCLILRMNDTVLAEENARLKVRLAETEAALADAVETQRRLESIIGELRRDKFGARSEKLDPEQLNLPLGDVEIAQGVLEAAQEKARRALKGRPTDDTRTVNRNRGRLPAHLPRIERVIEPESTLCPCGCGELTKIGEDVSERLDPPRADSPPGRRQIPVDPGAAPGAGDPPPALCLPTLLGCGGPGPCARTCGAGWLADRGADRPGDRGEVR